MLSRPLYRDRWDEVPPGMAPRYRLAVFHCHKYYFSASIEPTYIGSAHWFDDVLELTPERRSHALFAVFIRRITVRHRFNRGDMQFCNNHVIFHKRRAFEDFEDPSRKRHLLRHWLKADTAAAAFYERHGTVETVDRLGGIVGEDTILNAPLGRN